jgi:hypothetical protein
MTVHDPRPSTSGNGPPDCEPPPVSAGDPDTLEQQEWQTWLTKLLTVGELRGIVGKWPVETLCGLLPDLLMARAAQCGGRPHRRRVLSREDDRKRRASGKAARPVTVSPWPV